MIRTTKRRVVLVKDIVKSISETHPMKKERLVFLNTSDIDKGRILQHQYSLVKDWPGQAKKSIRRNDILFSEIRPANGRYAFVDIDADDYVVSTKLMVLRNSTPDLARYFYHFLTSKDVTDWLQHLAEARSGTFPQITFDHVAALQMPIPDSIKEREEIVATIDSLDDKVQQNRRTIRALEELTRAIFRAWFVDFEPVKAKAAGAKSFPSMPQEIFHSLPTRLVGSELGSIPHSWTIGPLTDVAEILSGGTPATAKPEYWDGKIGWASAKDVSQCGEPFLLETERCITQKGLDESATQIIPALSTVVVARGATTGRMTMFADPFAMNQTCYALVSRTRPFFLNMLCSFAMPAMLQAAHGSVFDTITKATIDASRIALPPLPLQNAYESLAVPLFQLVLASSRESRNLAELRDYLLPKLLSGTIRLEPNSSIPEK